VLHRTHAVHPSANHSLSVDPHGQVSFGRTEVDFVKLVMILVDDSAVEDGDATLTFGQHQGLAILHGLPSTPSRTSGQRQVPHHPHLSLR
jgi:hypothetical protein